MAAGCGSCGDGAVEGAAAYHWVTSSGATSRRRSAPSITLLKTGADTSAP
jgi:hypothetical protein